MSTLEREKEQLVVEIEPPADVIEHARKQADGETIAALEEHLLDAYLFEYEWIGVPSEE